MLFFGFACVQPEPTTADSAPAADAPYIYEEDAPPVAALSLDEVTGLVSEGVGAVWDYSASPIFTAYEAGMARASSGCPNYYDYDGSAYWYDTCTAADGTQFSGYSFYQLYAGTDAGDGSYWDGAALNGVGSIQGADGSGLEFGGSTYAIQITSQLPVDDPSWYSGYYLVIQGGFQGSGPLVAGSWLEADAGPDLSLYTYYAPSYEGRAVSLSGSLGGLGDGTQAVVFDGVYLMSENVMPDCPGEPAGVVSVRDADGSWYDVIYDGPATYDAPVEAELCDGCGEVYFRGEDLGAVCGVDFSGLLTPPGAG